jgi:hypothetical protein
MFKVGYIHRRAAESAEINFFGNHFFSALSAEKK